MKLLEPLADELRLLTEVLDEGARIEGALARVWTDARSTVPSFCGLSVSVLGRDAPFTFTVLRSGASAAEIRTSVLIPYPQADTRPAVEIILYARVPGAFVDLSADLAWLSARNIDDYVRDQHLQPLSALNATALSAEAVINQAIGVLVGRGYTVGEAGNMLDAAAVDGADRCTAAQAVLDSLDQPDADGFQDPVGAA